MKKNEVKNVESVKNVVVIEDAAAKLNLEVGNVYEFRDKRLSITGKKTHSEEDPTTGKKTLWSGEIDGVNFDEVDVTRLRKIFGLAERKRKSSEKVYIHEGYEYKLDESTDIMIEYAFDKYQALKRDYEAICLQYGITSDEDAKKTITAKIEAVCLARKVAVEEEKKRKEEEKQAKEKASKEYKKKVKDAKKEFFELLASGTPFHVVEETIKTKYSLKITELA